jgi:hypothetical protein
VAVDHRAMAPSSPTRPGTLMRGGAGNLSSSPEQSRKQSGKGKAKAALFCDVVVEGMSNTDGEWEIPIGESKGASPLLVEEFILTYAPLLKTSSPCLDCWAHR